MNPLINTKATRWFIISVILYAVSFVLPFLDGSTGAKFFMQGLRIFWEGKLNSSHWAVFAAFYIPLFSFPVFVALWLWRQDYSSKLLMVSIVLLLLPHIVVFIKIIERGLYNTITDSSMIGYGTWLLGFLAMVFAIYYKAPPEVPNNDFSQHLIEED
jgi:hypothetical protein